VGWGGRVFVEGDVNFAYVSRIKEVAEGNSGERSILSAVSRTPKGHERSEWYDADKKAR